MGNIHFSAVRVHQSQQHTLGLDDEQFWTGNWWIDTRHEGDYFIIDSDPDTDSAVIARLKRLHIPEDQFERVEEPAAF